ncbi:TPA: carbohydrate kinase family protein [Klebsiella pneumoniae]
MRTIACIGMAVADVVVGPFDSFHFQQDVTPVEHVQISPGGDAANVALNLAALSTPTTLFAKVGDDMPGQFLLRYYQQKGLDTRGICVSQQAATSTCVTLVKAGGERVFLYHGGATDTLCAADIVAAEVAAHDIVHASGFFLLPALEQDGIVELFAAAKAQGRQTSLDVGWDSQNRWMSLIRPVLPLLDYFMPTENEAREITGQSTPQAMAGVLLDAGVKQVVIKRGDQGAYIHDGREGRDIPPFAAPFVLDSSGAGDAFVAGFLAAIARDVAFCDAVRYANAAGSLAVRQYGASGALSSFSQLKQLVCEACDENLI